MTHVLITGATGFVGSHVLEAVARAPGLVPIAACRDPGRLLPGLASEVRIGDLRDAGHVAELVRDVDVICHAAAWTSAWGHTELSERHFLRPSLALLEQAAAAQVGRFIFLSSTSVAAPDRSADPMNIADPDGLSHWPHLRNVARIEGKMRALASTTATGMTVLRTGLFAGRRYAIGLLALLAPRLRTHLVPWVAGGRTRLPIIAGDDIGHAFALAAAARGLDGYQGFNIIGPQSPTARAVITYISAAMNLPRPHFSVPFPLAYGFARAMEILDPFVPWEPLVTRSVIHLLEETDATNERARDLLGYNPEIGWQQALDMQIAEMVAQQSPPISMARPL